MPPMPPIPGGIPPNMLPIPGHPAHPLALAHAAAEHAAVHKLRIEDPRKPFIDVDFLIFNSRK